MKARSWADQLVTESSEPFQHSRDVSKDRTDIVCLVPTRAELRRGRGAAYVWKTLEEMGSGSVFMLAANAVGLAMTFTSRIERTIGGDSKKRKDDEEELTRWEKAQERVLFTAQESGKLKAGLVEAGLKVGGRIGSWEDLTRQDAQARASLRAAMARTSLTLGTQERQALSEWGEKIVPIDALDLPEGMLEEWFSFEQESLLEQEYVMRCGQKQSGRLPQDSA